MLQRSLPNMPKAPTTIRRNVRKEYTAGDQLGYVTKSFTKDDGTEYHPAFDARTGEWSCDCASATYRPTKPCKHVLRAVENAVRAREAPPSLLARLGLTCCFRCVSTENLRPMAHDDGTPAHDVYICEPCARELREARRNGKTK